MLTTTATIQQGRIGSVGSFVRLGGNAAGGIAVTVVRATAHIRG